VKKPMRFWKPHLNWGTGLLTALLLPLWGSWAHSGEIALEFKVKTAFVHNFIPYINWPEGTFKNGNEPVRIGVLGDGPLVRAIPTLEEKNVSGRRIEVRVLDSLSDLNQLHILVVCESEKHRYREILDALPESGVLTIGNTASFVDLGGVIGFYLQEDKVRFKINLESARVQNLKISSKLLRLATLVD